MSIDDKQSPALLRRIAGRLPEARTFVAIVAVLAYVLLRSAYGRFYAPFGLTPDDLGLGYLELLAQSAVGAALLLCVFAIGLALALFGVIGLGASVAGVAPWSQRDLPRWMVSAVTVALVAAAGFTVAATGPSVRLNVVLAVLVAGAGVTAIAITRDLVAETPRPEGFTPPWLVRNLVVPIAALAVLGVAWILVTDAGTAGKAARSGHATDPELSGLRFVSWRADAAMLTWTARDVDPALRPLAGDCLMYLGQSDGTVFVFHPGPARRGTYRIPATTVVVRVVPGADCVRNKPSTSRP